MLGIFSGEFAKRQQMILLVVFGIPKVDLDIFPDAPYRAHPEKYSVWHFTHSV
jgi:hypothetical protein